MSIDTIAVPISPGELFDKITVLQVKLERIADPPKVENISRELEILQSTRASSIPSLLALDVLARELYQVNAELFDVIAEIYRCEKSYCWGQHFIDLSRSVYRLNDVRATIKRKINMTLGSRLLEEKAHLNSGPI